MDSREEMRRYRQRWQAVAEIERQELRRMSAEKHWQQINALARFASEQGLARGDDDGELEVFRRWARLKGAG
jgi:hypothetical protein